LKIAGTLPTAQIKKKMTKTNKNKPTIFIATFSLSKSQLETCAASLFYWKTLELNGINILEMAGI